MANRTRTSLPKKIRSEEQYKKIWISLFDIKILSSCNEKDFDLFCTSALLKTAFYNFINIKNRLCDAERLLTSQELELKALKLENDKYNAEFKCGKCEVCIHCQKINGIISSKWKSNTVDEIAKDEVVRKTRICGSRGNSIPSEITKAEDVEEFGNKNTRQITPTFGACKPSLSESGKGWEIAEVVDSAKSVLKDETTYKENYGKDLLSCDVPLINHWERCGFQLDNSSIEKEQNIFRTPEKQSEKFLEVVKKSPILKSSKRLKLSPDKHCQRSRKGEKSPSLLSDKTEPLQGANDALAISISGTSVITLHPRKNTKVSTSLSLKRKQSHMSPMNYIVSDVNLTQREALPISMKPDSPKSETICDGSSPEKEEDYIIMPSPSKSKAENLAHATEVVLKPPGKKKGCNKKKKRSNTRAMFPDTDVTYFVPMEDAEAMDDCSKDGSSPVFAHSEVMDQGDGKDVGIEEGGDCAEGSECGGAMFVPRDCNWSSFDRIPLDTKSVNPPLPYKYQRDAVRKRSERMKLEGWECAECRKYYEAAGHGGNFAEKKMHLNQCSRHRDKFSPRKNTPKGFWDPVFPETSE